MAAPAVRVRDAATGREVLVTPDTARDGFLKGAFKPLGDRVRVGRGKNTATVDASEVRQAIDSGWDIISEGQAADAKMRREQSTVAAQVQGTGEAFASGLSFGLTDLIQGDDKQRAEFRARHKELGTVGDAARLTGEVLPTLLSGGSSLAARGGVAGAKAGLRQGLAAGVRGAGVLPRAVEGLGVLAEKGVAKALGKGLKSRTAGSFVRGGIEGAASGIGEEIHESVLGDRELTAERLLAAAPMAALFGGGISAAFPLTGAAFRKGGELSVDATRKVLAAASDMAPDGSIVGGIASTIASGKRAGPMAEQFKLLAKDNPKLHRALHDQAAVVEEIGTRVRDAADAYGEAQRKGVAAFERDRAGNFGDLLKDTGDGQVGRFVADDIGETLGRLDDHLAVAKDPAYRSSFDALALDRSRSALALTADEVAGMSASKGYQSMVKALRSTQDELAKVRKQAKSPRTEEMLHDVEQMLKEKLTAPKYGDAGRAFKEVATADAAYFAAADRMGNTSVGRLLNRAKQSTNADAVDVVKRYGDFKATDRVDAARQSMDLDIAAMEARVKYSKSADMSAALTAMKAQRDGVVKAMDEAAENAQILSRQTEMGRSPMSGVLSAMGPSGPAVTGALLGGPVGAAIGGGLAMMARPGSVIRSLSAIKHAADGTSAKIAKVVKSITDTSGPAKGVAAKVRRKARKAAKGTRGVATRAAGRLGATGRGDDQRARQRRAQELSNPDTLERELEQEMFALKDAAPGVAEAAATKVSLGASFLASKLPPDITDPITGDRTRVDEATLAKFDRYHEAVTDPIASLERLKDGTFTVEHAEALREVWPSLFADIQEQTLVGMQEASDRGERLPYARRMSLGILLAIPTDATLQPSFLATMSQVHQAERAKEAAGAGEDKAPDAKPKRTRKVTMKTPKNYATTLGRIERHDV